MTRLYIIGGMFLAIIALIVLVAFQSSIVADLRQERDAANETIETDRRIDNADIGDGDPDDDREWLHQRGSR